MTFEEIVCINSKAKEGKLLGPSKKCADKPDNGITVQKPAAYHVIKDCAIIASKYTPLYVFGTYANPFQDLAGKVSLNVIKEFVSRAQTEIHTFQLMRHIIDRGRNIVKFEPSTYIPAVITSDENPYGDYDTETVTEVATVQIDTDDVTALCRLFGINV